MFTLESILQEKILNECMAGKCKSHCSEFTVSAVISAGKLLKNGKKDGHESLYSENIIHGPNCYLYFYFFCSLLCYVMATLQMACY